MTTSLLYNHNGLSSRLSGICIFVISLFITSNALAQCDFEEVAEAQNITHNFPSGSLAGGVSFIDFDNDGWDDLTFGTVEGETIEVYRNNEGQFEKMTLNGINSTCEMKQVTWIDFDNDGDKDLYFTCAFYGVTLYQNDGSLNFTDVTSDFGLILPSSLSFGASWADFDKDGWLDLFITYYGGLRNQLFRNLEGAGFENISVNANVDPTNKPSFCAVVFDYDHDGWEDIYIANDRSVKNDMIRNIGQSSFEDASAISNSDLPMDAMGVTLLDINADGYFEVYISNSPPGNALLFNNGDGTFTDITESSGTAFNSVGWGVNTLDIDNDALSDLYVSGSRVGTEHLSSALYRASAMGLFEQTQYPGMVSDTVMSFSNAVGDFNRDGKTDIAVSNGDGFDSQLWQNKCTNDNNWLRVQLEGTLSNRDAVGARAIAWCQGVASHQYRTAGIGFMAQNAGYLHFGLGGFELVDSLVVVWPSGVIDKIIAPEINKKHYLTEGTAAKNISVSTSKSIDHLCEGETVELSIDLKGRDFQIAWSDGTQEASTIITESGDYHATVTAGEITLSSENIAINYNEVPQVTYAVTHASNISAGSITIATDGDYSYRWSHDASLTTGAASNLEPGIYSVKITNDEECDITLNILVISEVVTSIDDPLSQSIEYRLVSGKLYIKMPNELLSQLDQIQLSNTQGQVLYKQNHDAARGQEFMISGIPQSEVLIVRFQFNDRYLVKKLLFQK